MGKYVYIYIYVYYSLGYITHMGCIYTQMLHVWYIYLQNWVIYMYVCIYIDIFMY